MTQAFELPAAYKKWTIGLIVAGVIALLYGFIMYHPFAHAEHGENVNSTRFWAVLLQNSVFWLLVVNASMFFIGVTTLAWGGWQVALRRVPEAISSVVPVLGIITFVILMAIVWGGRHDIYHWVDQ
jgi:drug/metabolite transporter (DMT)-like permease